MPKRFLKTAEEVYDSLVFESKKNPDDHNWIETLCVSKAPGIKVNLFIGSLFSIVGFVMWIRRIDEIKKKIEKTGKTLQTVDLIRVILSATIDNDSNEYTIVSYSGISFLFLAGIQYDFETTLRIMILFYIIGSTGDSIRVVLAYYHYNRLEDVVRVSQRSRAMEDGATKHTLKPSNVYEDISRGSVIVFMVFTLQVILIGFVCFDLATKNTTDCFDGTPGCPIGGTFASWLLYILGIFMASVYMLGPKTNFGLSEQNPSYWLHILLATKGHNTELSYKIDAGSGSTEDITETITISSGQHMYTIWYRFFQSYVINGVGFHILVHALPVQVASKGSLMGVVFCAVGMMYLVDLDDTPGPELHIVDEKMNKNDKTEEFDVI